MGRGWRGEGVGLGKAKSNAQRTSLGGGGGGQPNLPRYTEFILLLLNSAFNWRVSGLRPGLCTILCCFFGHCLCLCETMATRKNHFGNRKRFWRVTLWWDSISSKQSRTRQVGAQKKRGQEVYRSGNRGGRKWDSQGDGKRER